MYLVAGSETPARVQQSVDIYSQYSVQCPHSQLIQRSSDTPPPQQWSAVTMSAIKFALTSSQDKDLEECSRKETEVEEEQDQEEDEGEH